MGPDLVGLREAPLLQLGEDQLAIDADLESSANGGNDGESGDVHFFFVEDLFRQTDGFGLVASGRAVDKFQLHGKPPDEMEGSRVV